MIGAVLPWKEPILRLQLQFFSPCYVGINYCNVTPSLYRILSFQKIICNNFVPIVFGISIRTERKQPKDKAIGQEIVLGHQGPTRRDIPDPGLGVSRAKTLGKVRFFSCFRHGMAGMSSDLGRDVPGQKNFMPESLG